MPRTPLPGDLRRSAIRTSTASDHGVTRWRMRADDVEQPFYGASAIDLDLASIRDLAISFLPMMQPGQAFSHTTALALHGAPLPPLPGDLHVSVAFPRTPPRRPGVRGHSLAHSPVVLLDGMPVTPPVVAWAQSAAVLDRDDLVAVGDHLAGIPGTSLEQLAVVADSWSGRPGSGRLAWAAARIRIGVRSRPETHLRLLLVRSRLPEPAVAYPVAVSGGLTLHPDLAYPERKLALEYEGFGHFTDRRTVETDIERRELLAEVRWRTIRVTAPQLYDQPRALIARVRRHLAA